MNSLNDLKIKLENTSEMIAQFLAGNINENGYPARTYYGESFTISLFKMHKKNYSNEIKILEGIVKRRKNNSYDSHWEFNEYALQNYLQSKSAKYPYFIWTKVTNWILLRSYIYLHSKSFVKKLSGYFCSILILIFNMDSFGRIYDDYITKRRNYSDQYQAFCLVLLHDLFELTGIKFYHNRFYKGLNYILTKNEGLNNIIHEGRGKDQIFGYASIIYSLSVAFNDKKDNYYVKRLNEILDYLLKFKRNDGSFPLVLNKNEKGFPKSRADKDPKYPGWESYNNYFDYLPFLGYFLYKTVINLEK